MTPVLAAAPPVTATTTAPSINKRGSQKQNRDSRQTLFRVDKKKIQVTPTPVKCASAKGASSKAKKSSKPGSVPGDNVISEKEMWLAIKALLLQNFLNAKMKEWGKIAIEVALNLKMERRTVMHTIEDAVNDQDGKAQEGVKELETSWEGLTSSI